MARDEPFPVLVLHGLRVTGTIDGSIGTRPGRILLCKCEGDGSRGGAYGKRVEIPHGRATVSGDESQQSTPLAEQPLGRRWRVE
jgi:hypothetical protein